VIRLALISLALLIAGGCLPPVVVTPRAPVVVVDPAVEKRAEVFDAIGGAMGDTRLQSRHEVWRLLVQSQDRLGIERGKDAELSKAAGAALNPILGAAGDSSGRPIPLSATDRTAAATALRGLAAQLRGAK
jgi:hypothetical protein